MSCHYLLFVSFLLMFQKEKVTEIINNLVSYVKHHCLQEKDYLEMKNVNFITLSYNSLITMLKKEFSYIISPITDPLMHITSVNSTQHIGGHGIRGKKIPIFPCILIFAETAYWYEVLLLKFPSQSLQGEEHSLG